MNNEQYIPSSVEFAIYLNQVANNLNKQPGVTKIQKWLYVCYGLFLEMYETTLFDENPIAADYGPFFPLVHEKQKANNGCLDNIEINPRILNIPEYEEVVYTTLHYFGELSATKLVDWTHKKGTAWDKKYNIQNERYRPLDAVDIRADFASLIVREQEKCGFKFDYPAIFMDMDSYISIIVNLIIKDAYLTKKLTWHDRLDFGFSLSISSLTLLLSNINDELGLTILVVGILVLFILATKIRKNMWDEEKDSISIKGLLVSALVGMLLLVVVIQYIEGWQWVFTLVNGD